jgi:hypothetical protein
MATELPNDRFELRHAATDRPTFVVVPERRMFAIDGLGEPRLPGFVLASDALRATEERVRRRVARATSRKITPADLECAWWTHPEPPSQDLATSFADRSTWHWQQMIEIPPEATDEDAQASIDETRATFGRPMPPVRVIEFAEGRSAQILHIGGPADEHRSVVALYDAVAREGLHPHGHLHEIRLADYERVPDGRARAILRLPIES